MVNLKNIYEELVASKEISFERNFELARLCSDLLFNPETEAQGRDMVIRILDVWKKIDKAAYALWNDLIEVAGLYPYLNSDDLSGSSLIRHVSHASHYLKDIHFHEEQLKHLFFLNEQKSIIVSAPTSFGKSLLIEEIVASKKYKNIVIIQPTLALLDETRKKYKKYETHYKIIVSTNQRPSAGANIFLLTAERVVEYEDLPQIDFFVIDEFYKLSPNRNDDRVAVLNYAFYKLLKMTNKFYLLGPNIESIPDHFVEDFNAVFLKSNFATVGVDITRIDVDKDIKELELFSLLSHLKEPTLIYCQAPNSATKLMMGFVRYLEEKKLLEDCKTAAQNIDLIEWIDKNINSDWTLKKALEYGIGMHHGGLPRHVGSSIVEYFNKRKLRYVFCTSTLIEGVNTSAKNVVLFHQKKGLKPIDYFDFKNIVGRSGRMKEHFIGRVFQFYKEPESSELQVDIPFYTQTDAESELLIQLEPEDVKNKDDELYKKMEALEPDLKLLIKKNKGIPMEGQLKIIDIISADINKYHPLLSWNGATPTFEQLVTVINLAWDNLLKQKESKHGVRSGKQLAFFANKYQRNRSIGAYLNSLLKEQMSNPYQKENEPDDYLRKQDIIQSGLSVFMHWFEYKLPKMLKTMSELQKYVFEKCGKEGGNYDLYANQMENSFLPNNLAIFLEYGIPPSALEKLKPHVKKEWSSDNIITFLKSIDLKRVGLIDYEINKIKNSL